MPKILPWLLGGLMLVIYAITLNRWISPDSIFQISNLSGASWLSELTRPASFLVTLPLRLLPAPWIPPVTNFFTALCAALSLAVLARCVALLPYDRTRDERNRNPNRQGLLTLKTAWMPPTLAVFACGLQLTFWEHSVAATGEMFDLLLFACMVRCLLEYRIEQKLSWLLKFALLNGIAVANNWAMVAFFPVFLVAWLWIVGFFRFFKPSHVARFLKGRERFSLRTPLLMFGVWCLGTLLFFLLPLLASRRHISHFDFWQGTKFAVRLYRVYLSGYTLFTLTNLALMGLLPVSFMGIRWGKLLSEAHPFAVRFATLIFNVVHGFFLFGILWIILDSPFSPRYLQPYYACLPLYFLMALAAGYYGGYFLLIFTPPVEKARHYLESPLAPMLKVVATGVIAVITFLTPVELLYKNLPSLLRERNGSLAGYLDVLQSSMPRAGGVILSEDPLRLQYLESALTRQRRQKDYLLIDTSLLARQPTYFEFLEKKYPALKLRSFLPANAGAVTNTAGLVQLLNTLARDHEIYFMHPFAGYLGELFYQQPHKLFYLLKPYRQSSAFPTLMTPEAFAENDAFWHDVAARQFPELLRRIDAAKAPVKNNPLQRILTKTHIQPLLDGNAILAGGYYSLVQNAWGVELQRAGRLPEAQKSFEEALLLNSDNSAAAINLKCGLDLQARRPLTIDPSLGLEEKFNLRREWDQSLRQDGPADEPNLCYQFGIVLEKIQMYRQALQQFWRAQSLVPRDPNVSLRMAEAFLNVAQPVNALTEADHVLLIEPRNPRGLFLKGFAQARLGQYPQAIASLNDFAQFEPDNADAHLLRGYSQMKMNNVTAARGEYEQAIHLSTNPYGAYYGLAELGYRTKNPAMAITNCELYLATAPADAPEALQIKAWLAELKSPAATNTPVPVKVK